MGLWLCGNTGTGGSAARSPSPCNARDDDAFFGTDEERHSEEHSATASTSDDVMVSRRTGERRFFFDASLDARVVLSVRASVIRYIPPPLAPRVRRAVAFAVEISVYFSPPSRFFAWQKKKAIITCWSRRGFCARSVSRLWAWARGCGGSGRTRSPRPRGARRSFLRSFRCRRRGARRRTPSSRTPGSARARDRGRGVEGRVSASRQRGPRRRETTAAPPPPLLARDPGWRSRRSARGRSSARTPRRRTRRRSS